MLLADLGATVWQSENETWKYCHQSLFLKHIKDQVLVVLAQTNSTLAFSKAGTKVFLYIVFQCSSNVTNFILKEKNVANKYFFLLEILEKKEERRIYLITFNAYYTIVIKNIFLLQEEIHRTKENRNAQKQIYLCSVM